MPQEKREHPVPAGTHNEEGAGRPDRQAADLPDRRRLVRLQPGCQPGPGPRPSSHFHPTSQPRRTLKPLCATGRDGSATRVLRTPGPSLPLGPGETKPPGPAEERLCRQTAPTSTSTRYLRKTGTRHLHNPGRHGDLRLRGQTVGGPGRHPHYASMTGPHISQTPPPRAVGHTFEFSFPIPQASQRWKLLEEPEENSTKSTRKIPQAKDTTKASPSRRAEPDPSLEEHRKRKRAEYEQDRSQSPERKEYNRRYEQEKRRRAKELGKCRSCSNPAIPGQTRCPACAEKHRLSRRRSDARQRATSKQTTGEALENRGVGT